MIVSSRLTAPEDRLVVLCKEALNNKKHPAEAGCSSCRQSPQGFADNSLHDGCWAAAAMISVIFDAYVPENDGLQLFPSCAPETLRGF